MLLCVVRNINHSGVIPFSLKVTLSYLEFIWTATNQLNKTRNKSLVFLYSSIYLVNNWNYVTSLYGL